MASQEERDRIMAEYMASVQNDDDDEDEGEFEPTAVDDDDDSDVSHDEEDSSGVVLTGSLTKKDNRLVYSGTWKASDGKGEYKFKLKSKQQKMPLHWDASCPTVSNPNDKDIPRMRTLTFDGFFVTMEGQKMKERDVNVTFTVQSKTDNGGSNMKSYKDDDDDDSNLKKPAADNGEGKMPSKPEAQDANDSKSPSKPPSAVKANGDTNNGNTASVCGVFGRGTNDYGEFEIEGVWNNSHEKNQLVCRKRYVPSAAAAGGAAAATVSSDDDDGADDGVDYEELIALHQDAGLPVDELRKRYRESAGTTTRDGSNKRHRIEESDEEEFDGF